MPHWCGCFTETIFKVQKIHHKAPKVVYNNNKNYDELLRDNNGLEIQSIKDTYVL